MRPYLKTDVTGSLNYHQSETKMADSSEDELSDSSGNLSVAETKILKSLVVQKTV